MTDNEKRAHDLTMLYLKENIQLVAEETAREREGEQYIDVNVRVMDVYCELYSKFLKDVSARFTET